MPNQRPEAYADESFHEENGAGIYVLATVVFDVYGVSAARQAMLDLRGKRRTRKLHWNEMDRHDRSTAVKTIADLAGLHVVTVGSPVPRRRQERARAKCLHRLVRELHSYEVQHLRIESRTQELDKRDVNTVSGARFTLPKGTAFRVEHTEGASEPLFWAADIVAGAVRADRMSDGEYRHLLRECVYEIEIPTHC